MWSSKPQAPDHSGLEWQQFHITGWLPRRLTGFSSQLRASALVRQSAEPGSVFQKRFGLSHGLAFRFQVHFGIDAGSQDVGVAQPAPDRDHVHTRLQEMRSGGVPRIPSSEYPVDLVSSAQLRKTEVEAGKW